jgi:hypothetical protein
VAERSSGPKRFKRSSPPGRKIKKRRTANQRTALGLILKRFIRTTTASRDPCSYHTVLR